MLIIDSFMMTSFFYFFLSIHQVIFLQLVWHWVALFADMPFRY